jgi:hypothetical protein
MTEPVQASYTHPIGLIVDDDLARNRLTVFFRYLLAIPQVIWLVLWAYAMLWLLLPLAWLLSLILGRLPNWLHSFLGHYLRANSHLRAYLLLLANPWPPFLGAPGTYPVDVRIDPPAQQRRLTVFFRGLLAIPALLIATAFSYVNFLLMVFAWWYSMVFGRMHEGMRNASAWMFRYEVQAIGYAYLLDDRYPSFEGAPSA